MPEPWEAPQLFRPSSPARRAGTGVTLHTDQANGLLRLATVALSLHRQNEIEADLREAQAGDGVAGIWGLLAGGIGGVEGWRWAMSRGSPRMNDPARRAGRPLEWLAACATWMACTGRRTCPLAP